MDSHAESSEPLAAPRIGRPVSHRKPTKRLTQADIACLLKLRDEGMSQTQIAKQLNCDQAAVSRWLTALTDTTDISKSYLRGQSLTMAKNIVRNGRPADHVAALKGLSVLKDEASSGVQVLIGIKDSDVSVTLSPTSNTVNTLTQAKAE